MDCSKPGFPVHHQIPEFTQTHQSQWCHPTISTSVFPFSSCLQSFPTIRVFSNESVLHIRRQRTGASASALVLPMNTQDWSPLGWTGFIFLQSMDSQESSTTPQFKCTNLQCSAFFIVQLSPPYMTTGKTIVLTRWTFVGKVMSLLFTMLSRLIIAFLPRSKWLLISWMQSPSAVILEPPSPK